MRIEKLLANLEQQRGVEVFLQIQNETPTIRVAGPTNEITSALLDELSAHREAILAFLIEADDQLLLKAEIEAADRALDDPKVVDCGLCRSFVVDPDRPWSTIGRCRRFDALRVARLPDEACWAFNARPPAAAPAARTRRKVAA